MSPLFHRWVKESKPEWRDPRSCRVLRGKCETGLTQRQTEFTENEASSRGSNDPKTKTIIS